MRASPFFGSTDRYLGANNDKALLPWPTYAILGNLKDHFQGVQRYRNTLVLSCGLEETTSQLIVIRMGSRAESGPWSEPYGNPDYNYLRPSTMDHVGGLIDIDSEKWHAGGIQMAGPILAVPVYGADKNGEVRFYDFSDPERPVPLPGMTVVSPEKSPSRAVGLTRLPGGHSMLLVWDDHNLYFYNSRSTDIYAGFDSDRYAEVNPDQVVGGFQTEGTGPFGFSTYQNINFVTDCAGGVYIVGTRNTQRGSPVLPGKDYATLYSVTWPGDDFSATPEIVNLTSRQIYCYNEQCDFAAGAGLYVDDEGQMFLYGVPHYMHGMNGRINFNEYVSNP